MTAFLRQALRTGSDRLRADGVDRPAPTDVITTQRAALERMIAAHVGPGSRYALVDFPDHANVGDSAIWLGEIELLRAATGRGPDYVATWHDFDAAAFRAACPDGVLFLHGGGNLGDIWPHHQRLRETVLSEVRDHAVVQLPQSVGFRDPAGLSRFAKLANAHPEFTLYVRDERSLVSMRRHVDHPTSLQPDSAFALGPQQRGEADTDLLLLLRTDAEARGHGDAAPTGTVVDWLEDGPLPPDAPLIDGHEALARARVARGLALLSRGRRIVTDRLHGHILATLLGIPHVALDNDYGKVGAYIDAWTAPSPPLHRAATMREALALLPA